MDEVIATGPVFDGRAEAALLRGIEEVRHIVADEGKRLAAVAFLARIKVNEGRFVSRFTTTDDTRTYASGGDEGRKVYTMTVFADPSVETVVTNEIVTYGPWLEGTGSRNETTRFKGYHAMRMAAYALDLRAQTIADAAISPYVEEMN